MKRRGRRWSRGGCWRRLKTLEDVESVRLIERGTGNLVQKGVGAEVIRRVANHETLAAEVFKFSRSCSRLIFYNLININAAAVFHTSTALRSIMHSNRSSRGCYALHLSRRCSSCVSLLSKRGCESSLQ